ncbi:hypothetical protein N7507_002443 [Penicillium longicatenatum]|nr:hypothetical protein N7507_002443 [Penicillium longicatenatum]
MPDASIATQITPHFSVPSVTLSDRSRLLLSLGQLDTIIPHPTLPSSNALTRYLAGYFTGFYALYPFTHPPTFKLESCSQELCLAMMAVGAQDRFETTAARELFNFSKALLFDRQKNRTRSETRQSVPSSCNETSLKSPLIDEVRCLLCLAQFATWQSDTNMKTEACILQSLLSQTLQLSGLKENMQMLERPDWEKWAEGESSRRTKLLAFCFLGLQSIAYDTPPRLCFRCSCPEWTAPDAATWNLLQQNTLHEQGLFHDTLESLLSPVYQSKHHGFSPVANYVLIHGILQKIVCTRRCISGIPTLASFTGCEDTFVTALDRWTSCWQRTPESNLEPLDPNGPLPFTSTALLSLAYVSNCSDGFRSQKMSTWAPAEIAEDLRTSLSVARNWNTLLAAYHATNLLATLVKIGIQYFKHNQAVLWSIEATLCGLGSSIFLDKWLRRALDTMEETPLTGLLAHFLSLYQVLFVERTLNGSLFLDHEVRLLDWIQEVVYEGLSSLNDPTLDKSIRPSLLPDQIIGVWSHIMQGNSPLSFIRMIGDVLVEYRQTSSRGR